MKGYEDLESPFLTVPTVPGSSYWSSSREAAWAEEVESDTPESEDEGAFEVGTELDSEVWADTADQLAFRDRVLAAHIARSKARRGSPQRDLRPDELKAVPGTAIKNLPDTAIKTLPDTAAAGGRLLAAANADLAKAQSAGDADALRTIRLGATSGYRGSAHQRDLWLRYFAAKDGYYDRTQAARESLPAGPHSDQAVAYMLKPKQKGGFGLGGRIAAPGYSNHQAGIAIDLWQDRKKGYRVANKSDDASRRRWRKSWFHGWLKDNAATYDFKPIPTEEWHWEYRPGATRAANTQRSSREAYEDLESPFVTTPTAPGGSYSSSSREAAWTREEESDTLEFEHDPNTSRELDVSEAEELLEADYEGEVPAELEERINELDDEEAAYAEGEEEVEISDAGEELLTEEGETEALEFEDQEADEVGEQLSEEEDAVSPLPEVFSPSGLEDALPQLFDAERPGSEEEIDEEAELPTDAAEGWVVPQHVLAAGGAQDVEYDDAPAWDESKRNCAGRLSEGARVLRRYLLDNFPGIREIGGYNCRKNSASPHKLSVHGTGRALDIMVPTREGRANSGVGDPIANWLVLNASAIGVQYLIWNLVRWSGGRRRRKFARYTGPNPHRDHVHVELNQVGAEGRVRPTDGGQPETIDYEKAVKANRQHADRLGWHSQLREIAQLLGLPKDTSEEREFARAVARWQRQQGLNPVDGILGPKTWERMRSRLKVSSGEVPEELGAANAPAQASAMWSGTEYEGPQPRPFIPVEELERKYPLKDVSLHKFRSLVYMAQVKLSQKKGQKFVESLPDKSGVLDKVEGVEIRTSAAQPLRDLLNAARQEIARLGKQIKVNVGNAYRPADWQFRTWATERFPDYYEQATAETIDKKTGKKNPPLIPRGDFGEAAAEKLARYISGKFAAPGFSNHQDGLAVDFRTTESFGGKPVTLKAQFARRPLWWKSWFWNWLKEKNAYKFGFVPYKVEPWHWEYRPDKARRVLGKTVGTTKQSQPTSPSGPLRIRYTSRVIPPYTDKENTPQSTDCSLFVPSGLRGVKAIDLLVFFHGLDSCWPRHNFDPDKVIENFGLDSQVDKAARKVALVVPIVHWGGNTGGVWSAARLNTFVEEVVDEIGKHGPRPSLSRLIIAGHSKAYGIMTPLAAEFSKRKPETSRGGLAQLAEVWALDTTYGTGHADAVGQWADTVKNARFSIILHNKEKTKRKDGTEARNPLWHWNDSSVARKTPRNVRVVTVPETHCDIPKRHIEKLLS